MAADAIIPPKLRNMVGAGYGVVLLIWAVSLTDLLMRLWPLRISETNWRIGAVGTFSGSVGALVLTLFIAFVIGGVLGHRRLVRVLSVLTLVAALSTLVLIPLFALDVLQLRRSIRPDGLRLFDVTMLRALATLGLTAAALLWIGRAGWKSGAARRAARDEAPERGLMRATLAKG